MFANINNSACLQGFAQKRMERDTGLEPATSSLGSWHSMGPALLKTKGEMQCENTRCTPRCTNFKEFYHETAKTDNIRELLATLTREELIALLTEVLREK